jgi:hypothetical protein
VTESAAIVWTISRSAQLWRTFDAVGSVSKGEPWTRRESESYETRSAAQPTDDDVIQALRRNGVLPFLSSTGDENEESVVASTHEYGTSVHVAYGARHGGKA